MAPTPIDPTDSVPHAEIDGCASGAGVLAQALEVRGANGPLPARLYTLPSAGKSDGLIVFFPCGGFRAVDLDMADTFARMLARATAFHVLACTTTPASRCPFPAAAEDGYAALQWATAHRARLGWRGKRLIVAGVEAGGNLAAVSALMARDRSGPTLAAQLLIMPMLDPGLTTCSMRAASHDAEAAHAAGNCAAGYRDYLPRAIDRTHPYASPLRSSRMQGLAPCLVLAAQDDPLRDEAELYGEKLALAGIHSVVKRLPPIAFGQPNARSECLQCGVVLHEIAAFLRGLDPAKAVPDAPDQAARCDRKRTES